MAKKLDKTTEELELNATENTENVSEATEETPKNEKKYILIGRLVRGACVYSNDGAGGTVEMTDEIAEGLIASNPSFKQHFKGLK